MKVLFRGPDYFAPSASSSYQLLPFRFMRWPSGEVLLSNESGEYLFLDADAFRHFHERRLPSGSALFADLKAKHFLTDGDPVFALELLATKVRTKKSFLDGFTKLHLFVVTLRCEHSCPYCQVSRVTEDRAGLDMTAATVDRAVDLMFRSPSDVLKVEFQGGESLLNFAAIQRCVERTLTSNTSEKRQVEFVIATNLALVSDEMLAYCAEQGIVLSTSLDGPAFIHNANRPRPGGNSHQLLEQNLARARVVLGHDGVSALLTTTALTLRHPIEVVHEYVRLGFETIFLRSLSPYGFARRGGQATRYGMTDFVEFYRKALAEIIEVNRRGTRLTEVFAQILLRKILTPFAVGYVDLQSPTGAVTGCVVYNYDGDVYASDEARMLAEMKDQSFKLGNVHRNTYEEMFAGPVARALVESSCAETLPGCADCAFVPFCGGDPIFHWATQGDPIGNKPTSAFCQKNMSVIGHLLDLLRDGDAFTKRLLVSWGTGVPLAGAA
jgi:His-Xaa-Ser system radical SAM maturase HxsB